MGAMLVLGVVTWDDVVKKQRRLEYVNMVWRYHRSEFITVKS